MRTKYSLFFTIPIILLATLISAGTVLAAPVEVKVPGTYNNIQDAINYAADQFFLHPENSYTVLVEPGAYTVPTGGIVLKSNISVRGRETARTFINGGGSGTAVNATSVTGLSFNNFTVTNAGIGIHVSGNSTVSIAHNVFNVGTAGTAVIIQDSGSSTVINNTFYENGIAIQRNTDTVAITSNIFYNSTNTIKISQTGLTENNISYNLYYPQVNAAEPKGTNYIPNLTITAADPLFVDLGVDFHIRSNPTATSPCIDHGSPTVPSDAIDESPSDIGAYGGTTQDSIPYLISGVTATLASADSVSVSWSENTSYVVNDINPVDHVTTGGYHVYYGLQSNQTVSYPNKLTVSSTVTTSVISGLTTTAAPPAAPIVNLLGFDNNQLLVSWSSVSGATGYIVYSRETSTTVTTQSGVINGTSHTLDGLVNGTDYTVWVTAVTQPRLYLAVTAFDYTQGPFSPGFTHESAYSPEIPVALGPQVESVPSNTVTGFPEAYVYNPNLPNKGCFIATAAYGYYDAPQVQALRDFRDRYLETNSAGRAFVAWYYQYGPIGAAALNEHPWLKPVVRTALLPAVGGALFLTRLSLLTQLLVLFIFITALLVLYKKSVTRGGSR